MSSAQLETPVTTVSAVVQTPWWQVPAGACRGLTPAEADLYFLDSAKKCAMYGMDMHTVKNSANKEVSPRPPTI